MTPRKVRRELERLGFRLERLNHHAVYRHRNGRLLFCSRTPSDVNAVRNIMADARRIAAGQPTRHGRQVAR